MLQVVEGPEAGAEVVEREAAAEPGEALHERARLREVGDRGGLGHLEDQPRGVDARVGQSLLHEQRQVGVAQRLGGEVHLEAQLVRGAAQQRRPRAPPPSGRARPPCRSAPPCRGRRPAGSARRRRRAGGSAARAGSTSPVWRSMTGWAWSSNRSCSSARRMRPGQVSRIAPAPSPSSDCEAKRLRPPSLAAYMRVVGGHEHVAAGELVVGVEERDADARGHRGGAARPRPTRRPTPPHHAAELRRQRLGGLGGRVRAGAPRTRRRRCGRPRPWCAGARAAAPRRRRSARRRRRARSGR